MGIYEKLLNIQTTLKAPKGQFNKFGNYKYRNCEDILESLKPLLSDNKVVVLLSDDIVAVNNRIYVKATATLKDTESDEKIETTAFAREEETKKGMDGSQITGSASSYARKYALNAMFAIDDTKDSDTTNQGQNENKGNAKNDTAGEKKEKKDFNRDTVIEWLDKKYADCDPDTKTFLKEKLKFMKKSSFKFCKDEELKEIGKELKERDKTYTLGIKEMTDYIQANEEKHHNLISETLERTGEPFISTLDNEEIVALYNLIKGNNN